MLNTCQLVPLMMFFPIPTTFEPIQLESTNVEKGSCGNQSATSRNAYNSLSVFTFKLISQCRSYFFAYYIRVSICNVGYV